MKILLKFQFLTLDTTPKLVSTYSTTILNFRSLQRKDIQTLVGHGCPSLEPKVIFSAKLLRKLVHLDEGDVCIISYALLSCISNELCLVPRPGK